LTFIAELSVEAPLRTVQLPAAAPSATEPAEGSPGPASALEASLAAALDFEIDPDLLAAALTDALLLDLV
jgi:hypothetical protein